MAKITKPLFLFLRKSYDTIRSTKAGDLNFKIILKIYINHAKSTTAAAERYKHGRDHKEGSMVVRLISL